MIWVRKATTFLITFFLLVGYLPSPVLAEEEENNYTFPFDNLFEDYHEYDDVVSELQMFANDYPEIVRLYRLTDLVPDGQTWQGRHVYAVKVSDGVLDEPEYYSDPSEESTLIMGNHHAREWMTVQIPLYYLYFLTEFYGMDPTDNDGDGLINEDPIDGVDNDNDGEQGGRTNEFGLAMFDGVDNDGDGLIDEGIDEDPREDWITDLVNNYEIWIVPLVNPDGYSYDREDPSRFWRKNLRDNNADNATDSCDGVDLNRNYPLGWNTVGSSSNTCSQVYHGNEDSVDDDNDNNTNEDPEDSNHTDDDNDGFIDEDRDGGFSEPETQAIQHLIWRLDIYNWETNPWDVNKTGASDRWPSIQDYRTEKHDGNHSLFSAITYHAYGEYFDWPWAHTTEPSSDDQEMRYYGERLQNLTGYSNWKDEGGYLVGGDTCDWIYGNQGTFCYLAEVNGETQGELTGGFHADSRLIIPTARMHLLTNLYILVDDLMTPFEPPNATIDSIAPSPARFDDEISFNGTGSDINGTVMIYEWNSSIDGFLSSEKDFNITDLSIGTHIISFRVQDNDGDWSEWATAILVVNPNSVPTSTIESISPLPTRFDSEVTFNGSGSDSDGSIIAYEWNSSIDGFLSNEKDFNITGFTPGVHIVSFRVQDNDDVWSDWVIAEMEIYPNSEPVANITNVYPDSFSREASFGFRPDYCCTESEGTAIFFEGEGYDSDGQIIAYSWRSSIDGFLSNQSSFSTDSLSVGRHTIYFAVLDNDNSWSNQSDIETKFATVWIYSEPEADAGIDQSSIRGVSINFNGQGSDIDGQIVLWEWDFDGDGFFDWSSTDSGTATRSYSAIGDFNPVLRVTDNDGFIATDSFSLKISTEDYNFPNDNPNEALTPAYISAIVVAILLLGLLLQRRV